MPRVMKSRTQWTLERDAILIALALRGLMNASIADEFKISVEAIKTRLTKLRHAGADIPVRHKGYTGGPNRIKLPTPNKIKTISDHAGICSCLGCGRKFHSQDRRKFRMCSECRNKSISPYAI